MSKLKISPVKNPKRIISYLKHEWRVIVLASISGLLFNGFMPYSAISQGDLIDTIVSKKSLNNVIMQGLIFLGIILFLQFNRYLKRYYVRLFANRTTANMRMMIYNNIMHKSIIDLEKEETGDLMTKAIGDVEATSEGMRKVITEIFDTGVLMISFTVALIFLDWKLTLLSMIFMPAAIIIAEKLKTIIFKYNKDFRKQVSKVAELTYYNIEHTVLFRVNGIEDVSHDNYVSELDDLEKKSVKANILENSMQPVYNAISMFGMVFIIYLGTKNVITDNWTVGKFTAYTTIFTGLAIRASKAAKLFNSYQKAVVSWQRIKPHLTEFTSKNKANRPINRKGSMDISSLSFSYPGMEEDIIKSLSFKVSIGEIVGVTGPIASGKSTLGVALEGLYPYSGKVTLDGVDLSEYSQYELSQRISYLGHKSALISDTIYNNITLGLNGDISKVLSDVCFDEDLRSMPKGIDTLVGSSGVSLSGGQQARIALARALYHHGHVLILDDPFAAVDMKTEEKMIENLRNNYKDTMILLISHRLSVFPNTDKVVFLHNDKTYEVGKHEELMESSSLYAEIYNLQTGGENNDAQYSI